MTALQVSIVLSGCAIGCLLAAIVQRRWASAILGIILAVVAAGIYLTEYF